MAQRKVVLLNPTVPVRAAAHATLAPRLPSLQGKKAGVLWNEKPNGDVLLARLKERLGQSFGVSGRVWRTKHPAVPASKEMLDQFAETCDVVISGIGD